MAFLHYAKDYVNGFCSDVCETLVHNVRTWYDVASSPLKRKTPQQLSVVQPCSKAHESVLWQTYESLYQENSKAREEYRRLRLYVDLLAQDYELSKDVDIFRRYGLLKSMIKRTLLHVQLSAHDMPRDLTKSRDVPNGKHRENERNMREKLKAMSAAEVQEENQALCERTKLLRVKIRLIRDHMEELDRAYTGSKHLLAVIRYTHMKDMIKALVHNDWVKD